MKALVAAVMILVSGLNAMASPANSLRGTLSAPEFWAAYKHSFISPGGRVIDNANGDISHSEGQGYGMLLAVAADDPSMFETLWIWTRTQLMLRDDGLAAWRWDPAATPHVKDRNNASDGDILIAWALAEAGAAWNQAPYKAAALKMIRAIADNDLMVAPIGPVLKPGTAGFAAEDRADGPVVNLSYWIFPALARFADIVPDRPFASLITSGLKLAATARFGPQHLPSDWISLVEAAPTPAKTSPATFGYDAIRVPLYLIWGGLGTPDALAPYAALFANPAANAMRSDVVTGQSMDPFSDSGYRAIGALVRCTRNGSMLPAEFKAAAVDRYYPSTLRALVLIAARQAVPRCL